MRVKICGITNPADALAAAGAGADAVGYIFYPKSPRYVAPEEAGRISRRLPLVSRVGVFVNEARDIIVDIVRAAGLDAVQLHGEESPAFVAELARVLPLPIIKAARVRGPEDVDALRDYSAAAAFLLDAFKEGEYGGTGRIFDWELARGARDLGPIILSGGLGPDNAAEAVRRVRPFAVDVSSGVESRPGVKDQDAVRRFVAAAKDALR